MYLHIPAGKYSTRVYYPCIYIYQQVSTLLEYIIHVSTYTAGKYSTRVYYPCIYIYQQVSTLLEYIIHVSTHISLYFTVC